MIFSFRACLREGGGPQVGEAASGGLPHLSRKRNNIKMRDYMDRRVTPPKRVTSPIWGTQPPGKQVLSFYSCTVYPLLTDTSLLRTVHLIPEMPNIIYTLPLSTLSYGHLCKADNWFRPFGFRIKEV